MGMMMTTTDGGGRLIILSRVPYNARVHVRGAGQADQHAP